ncbi:MAG: hypothetical protein IIC76_15235 [Bacteroidetes bacterium]|nr:hypothetical protein [Bacteroidota bacterium]
MMLKIILITLSIFTAIFLAAGCTEEATTQPPSEEESETIPKPLFSDIQDKVFTPICDRPGCHGTTNTQVNLLLREGEAYQNLVGVPSLLFPGMTRVIPDSSSKSLLIKILKGEVSPRMPLDGPFLEDAIIDSIAKWIDNGAINN